MKRIDIQRFATELAPEIAIDAVNTITTNVKELMTLLNCQTPVFLAQGSTVKSYKWKPVTLAEQVGKGEDITETEVSREVAATTELTLKKYRKRASIEDLQKYGVSVALNKADEKLVRAIQKGIKGDMYTTLLAGTGKAKGVGLQAALAKAWSAVGKVYEDEDCSPIYFISSDDVADYLGSANITTQTVFGMTIIQNFLGLGDVVVTPSLASGKFIATAKENLKVYAVDVSSSDIAELFELYNDDTNLVGITHSRESKAGSIDTIAFSGVSIIPEFTNGVIIGTIAAAPQPTVEESPQQ